MSKAFVVSLNISKTKGVIKKPVEKIEFTKNGIKGDAHAGKWNRQVSLLASESISEFQNKLKREIAFGEFAENITTKNIDLKYVNPLDVLQIGKTKLIVTQLGKKCQGKNCTIFQEVGDCIMPAEGVFAKVKKKGEVKTNDEVIHFPRIFKVRVITLSDRASEGVYEDKSGNILINLIKKYFEKQERIVKVDYQLIPDKVKKLHELLKDSVRSKFDIVITTGGTGVGPKDITPDVFLDFIDKEIPGIMEYIRQKYGVEKPRALISRSLAGIKSKTLLFALPGKPKAVVEYFEELKAHFFHMIYMLHGLDIH